MNGKVPHISLLAEHADKYSTQTNENESRTGIASKSQYSDPGGPWNKSDMNPRLMQAPT